MSRGGSLLQQSRARFPGRSNIRVEERSNFANHYYDDDDDDDEGSRKSLQDELDESEAEEERRLSELNGEAAESGRKKTITGNSPENKRKKNTVEDENMYKEKVTRARPKLTADLLTGADGLIRLPHDCKKLRVPPPKSRTDTNGAAAYCRALINQYERFTHQLFPSLAHEDVLLKIEQLGTTKQVKEYVENMRQEHRNLYLEKILGREKAIKILNEYDEDTKQQQIAKLQQKQNKNEKKDDTNVRSLEVVHDRRTPGFNREPEDSPVRTVATLNDSPESAALHNSTSASPTAVTPIVNVYNNVKERQHTQNKRAIEEADDDEEEEFEATFDDDEGKRNVKHLEDESDDEIFNNKIRSKSRKLMARASSPTDSISLEDQSDAIMTDESVPKSVDTNVKEFERNEPNDSDDELFNKRGRKKKQKRFENLSRTNPVEHSDTTHDDVSIKHINIAGKDVNRNEEEENIVTLENVNDDSDNDLFNNKLRQKRKGAVSTEASDNVKSTEKFSDNVRVTKSQTEGSDSEISLKSIGERKENEPIGSDDDESFNGKSLNNKRKRNIGDTLNVPAIQQDGSDREEDEIVDFKIVKQHRRINYFEEDDDSENEEETEDLILNKPNESNSEHIQVIMNEDEATTVVSQVEKIGFESLSSRHTEGDDDDDVATLGPMLLSSTQDFTQT